MSSKTSTTSKTKNQPKLTVQRHFTVEGVHPYDDVEWERRTVEQKNWKTGEIVFRQQ